MTDTLTQIPVAQAAVVKRVNRRLAPDKHMYKSSDGWYVVDLRRSHVTDAGVELESFARRVEALAGWERLAGEEQAAREERS